MLCALTFIAGFLIACCVIGILFYVGVMVHR
jgi:hypothetical protein